MYDLENKMVIDELWPPRPMILLPGDEEDNEQEQEEEEE